MYELPRAPNIQRQVNGATVPLTLNVRTPSAGGEIDSRRILVAPEPNVLQVYAGSRWSDPAPVLVRNRLVETLRQQGYVQTVMNDDPSVRANAFLQGDLLEFQSAYVAGASIPQVRITYTATLVKPISHTVIAQKRFSVVQPAAGKEVPLVVQAFGLASDNLAQQVAQWSQEILQMHASQLQ